MLSMIDSERRRGMPYLDYLHWYLLMLQFPTVHLLIVIQQYCVFPVIGIWMLNDVVVKLSNSVEL